MPKSYNEDAAICESCKIYTRSSIKNHVAGNIKRLKAKHQRSYFEKARIEGVMESLERQIAVQEDILQMLKDRKIGKWVRKY